MPRIAEHTRTRRRTAILTAALACFARTGFHATTMADIATEAGVSKGTPYLYFASKEELFHALYETWDCGVRDRIRAAIDALPEDDRGSPRRVLHTAIVAVGAHVAEHTDTCRVLMEARTLAAYQPTIAATVTASDAAALQQFQGLVTAGIEAGQWPPDTDPTLEARLLTAAVHGLMAQWHLNPGAFSWDEASRALARR